MKKVRLKMKINNNGLLLDTDKDIGLCGVVNKDGEITLYKTSCGEFYSHIVIYNEGEEIEMTPKEEAAEIMMRLGFSYATIKHETGIDIFRKMYNEEDKKVMYN